MYKCLTCGNLHTFQEIIQLRGERLTLKEYSRQERKADVKLRCPDCEGRTFEKIKGGVKKIKAR